MIIADKFYEQKNNGMLAISGEDGAQKFHITLKIVNLSQRFVIHVY